MWGTSLGSEKLPQLGPEKPHLARSRLSAPEQGEAPQNSDHEACSAFREGEPEAIKTSVDTGSANEPPATSELHTVLL